MKVLFPISIFYPSQFGGPANSVYFLAKELSKNGVEVFVITTTIGIKNLHEIKINEWSILDGINIYYSNKYLYRLIPKNLFTMSVPQVDIIHFSSFFDYFNLHHMFSLKNKNAKFIFSPRGELQASALAIKAFKKKIFMKNFLIQKVMKNSSFHVTSKYELKQVKKVSFINSKVFNIPNIMKFNLNNKKTYENIYNFKYILYLGRISRIKNIELLIKVYSSLNIDKEIKLVIAGDINDDIKYYKELNKLVIDLSLEKKVIFTERRIEGGEKESLYHNAELFVLPSKSENFGMVVLESLIQETSVITTKGTPWSSLNDNECGYWVNMNFSEIKKSIENYFSLSDREKKDMAKRGVLLAKEFSSEKLISKYLDMYEDILG